jgi:hypothetical protein
MQFSRFVESNCASHFRLPPSSLPVSLHKLTANLPEYTHRSLLLRSRLHMSLSVIIYTFLCTLPLHVPVATEPSLSLSWSPLQTLSENVEYDPQLQHRPISALEVLQQISHLTQKVHTDSFFNENDAKLPFGPLSRYHFLHLFSNTLVTFGAASATVNLSSSLFSARPPTAERFLHSRHSHGALCSLQ